MVIINICFSGSGDELNWRWNLEIGTILFLIPRIYIFPHPVWESQPLKPSVR
jgi:hypothetical protein